MIINEITRKSKWCQQKCSGGVLAIWSGGIVEIDIILAKLKLLNDTEKKHLLFRLKKQHKNQKAIKHVCDHNAALGLAMRVSNS